MIVVFYIPVVQVFEAICFFEVIVAGHLGLLLQRSAFVLDTWAHVVGLKKEVTEANKIMKLRFFLIMI